MNVKTITESINAIFKKVRGAAPAIPPMLMALGAPQRPGLSTIISTSNIVKALNKHGIPTSAAEDGSENKTVAVVIAIVEEVYRAIHQDANIQVALQPGSINIISNGANGGGPMVSEGINTNFASGMAIIQ